MEDLQSLEFLRAYVDNVVMSVEEIKREIASLTTAEQQHVADFLLQLRHGTDTEGDLGAFLRERLAQAEGDHFSHRSVSEIWQEVRVAR